MKQNFVKITLLFLAVAIVFSSSAFAYKKVKCFMPQAPDIDLEGVKRVAILDFEISDYESEGAGKVLADLMIEYLLMEDRGITAVSGGFFRGQKDGVSFIEGLSTRCFDIVERSHLESVMDELSLGRSGVLDESQVSHLGGVLGVDIIISGEVALEKSDYHFKERRSKRVNKKQVFYTVNCTKRTVTMNASIRIVDAKTGKIIDIKRSRKSFDNKWCGGFKKQMAFDELETKCLAHMAWEFSNLINPWYAYETFEFDKIKIKEFKKDADIAAKAAQNHELRKSYAIFKTLYESDSYNPKFLYNMGILFEISGDFMQAKEMYGGAAMLKDDKKYKRALERIERRSSLVPFYANLDMAIVPVDFESAIDDESLFAQVLKMKGKSQKRYPVYASASKDGKVLVKIPGEIQLQVLSVEGAWYRIKLPIGGKEGYVHKDQVKE